MAAAAANAAAAAASIAGDAAAQQVVLFNGMLADAGIPLPTADQLHELNEKLAEVPASYKCDYAQYTKVKRAYDRQTLEVICKEGEEGARQGRSWPREQARC